MPQSFTLTIDEPDLYGVLAALRRSILDLERANTGLDTRRVARLRRVRDDLIRQRDAQLASRAVADEGV